MRALPGGPATAARAVLGQKETAPAPGSAEAAVWSMPVPLGGDGTD
jgi:hypothetical protein